MPNDPQGGAPTGRSESSSEEFPWELFAAPTVAGPLLVLCLGSVLLVLPLVVAAEFLSQPGPAWAFALAGVWLVLLLRLAWHGFRRLGPRRLDRLDIAFLVAHASFAVFVVVSTASSFRGP